MEANPKFNRDSFLDPPFILADRRFISVYCELMDVLDQLREADYGLYLISLNDLCGIIQARSKREVEFRIAFPREEDL